MVPRTSLSVADLRGGGFRGFKPPPWAAKKKKKLMCIEKRHHNVQTHTVCSYSTLSQAQPQTIGFNPPPPPPLGCQVNMWRYHGLLFMVSIALVDARKTSLTGVQNSTKKSARRYAASSWTMVSIALVDARKTSLTGVQNSKKNRLAALRLVDDGLHCVSRCQENITYGGSK